MTYQTESIANEKLVPRVCRARRCMECETRIQSREEIIESKVDALTSDSLAFDHCPTSLDVIPFCHSVIVLCNIVRQRGKLVSDILAI